MLIHSINREVRNWAKIPGDQPRIPHLNSGLKTSECSPRLMPITHGANVTGEIQAEAGALSSGDNMELGQLELGFALDNPENPFRSQNSVFVQLSLWDSYLQRAGETRSACDEEAIPQRALSWTPQLPEPGRCPEKGAQKNLIAEPFRFGALNVHSPSSFLVKSVQVETF